MPSSTPAVVDPLVVLIEWLGRLNDAAGVDDLDAFLSLFLPTGWMRDLLCFSWEFRSLAGREMLAKYLSERVAGDGANTRFSRAGLHDVCVQTASTLGPPSEFAIPGGTAKGVQGAFEFALSSPPRIGRGFVRLVPDPNSEWKAFALLMNLEDIQGHEEPRSRPLGLYPHHATWEEVHAARMAAIEQDPTVLVVGGGQTGLMCAARLGRMGVRALVVDKTARVGDVWRKRYPNLTLHTTAQHCAVLYDPWPKTFPKYVPKEKVANFLESYAIEKRRWKVTVNREGEEIVLTPRHIIMCTGTGKAYMPDFPGVSDFKGVLYHSDGHRGAAPFKGKRVIVVGACNAAQDVCIDFVAKGAQSVTMVQRSATCVMSASTSDKIIFDVTFNEKFAVEDADFMNHSMPHALALRLSAAGGTQRIKAFDKELLDGLANAGFNLTWELTPGGGEVGLLGFFFERTASGTMLDMGCGQLIIDGKVKVKGGEISRFERDSVVFTDGSRLPADVVVCATGYLPVITNVTSLFGASITEKIGNQVWGLDAEGELNKCFRPTGQPGLWIAMGTFQHGRFFSKHLALQILADELGLRD